MRFIKYTFILSLFSPAIVFSAESVDLCSSSFISDEQYTPTIMAYLQRPAKIFTSVSDRALQAGLSGIAFAKRLRGAKTNSSAEKAEEVLGIKLNPSQQRAVEEAYLVGSEEKGKDGSLAGIGNYTQAQLRRKNQILKEAGLSPSQRRKLMESGVVGDDFIRNAGIKLEQDLQAIRNSLQEPRLIEQGFKPSYYAGVDQAREFKRLHEYLREIQADPKRTHIPYFANQVEKTISDFERGLRKQNVTRDGYYEIKDPKFLEKRLEVLEAFKKEARRRVENQDVTYDWWIKFNTKLAVLGSPDQLGGLLISRPPHSVERVKMGVEIEYNRQLAQLIENALESELLYYGRIEKIEEMREKLKSLNPEDIFFGEGYTSQELESMVFELDHVPGHLNSQSAIESTLFQFEIIKEDDWYDIDVLRIREGIEALVSHGGVRGLNGRKEIQIPFINQASKEFPEKMLLFTTNELGIMAFNEVGNNSHFVGLSGDLENMVDSRNMSPYDYLTHDIDHIDTSNGMPKEVLERVGNISNRSDREKAALVLFIYRHETAGGYKNDFSQSALEDMMFGFFRLDRWFNPNDLQGLLPDGVNVKDKSEVKSFLSESATFFGEILSDLN